MMAQFSPPDSSGGGGGGGMINKRHRPRQSLVSCSFSYSTYTDQDVFQQAEPYIKVLEG